MELNRETIEAWNYFLSNLLVVVYIRLLISMHATPLFSKHTMLRS
jgi:hypothetical protein